VLTAQGAKKGSEFVEGFREEAVVGCWGQAQKLLYEANRTDQAALDALLAALYAALLANLYAALLAFLSESVCNGHGYFLVEF
jgi:hypothetical protein